MLNQERFTYLYQQYTSRSCSREELDEFFAYVNDKAWQIPLEEAAFRHYESLPSHNSIPGVDWEFMYGKITGKVSAHENIDAAPVENKGAVVVQFNRWKSVAALVFVTAIATLGYIFFLKQGKQPAKLANTSGEKVFAGKNKAVLTLNDGRQVVLDSSSQQLLAQEMKGRITKLDSTRLSFHQQDPSSLATTSKPEMNTITTPNGAEYNILLPDGTRAWINAASSLSFPAAFTGNERNVTVTGEVYFEVAGNKAMPFKVSVNDALVEVLGTSFNINAYSNEPLVKTTLLSGSVKLSRQGRSRILRPGEQAQFSNSNNNIQLITDADTEEAIAWKNGSFHFNSQPIMGVLNQIARWYNMEIIYEGEKPAGHFSGILSRNTDLATVLRTIELSGIHFRIESNPAGNKAGKLIVLP